MIRDFFREILFADEVEEPKPSPEPLLEIMRRLGVRLLIY
ncbi:MAG: HAD hydrolase-like protein [Deltaproteobacteria bacterium]|nr:HAD hydrolase-like protein [Deltaproteobacteria bacterium]